MKIKSKNMDAQMLLILLLIGLAAGFMGGLIGIGGGVIIVPALVYLLGFTQFKAQGTSLAMLMLPVGIMGVIQYYKEGHVDYRLALILAVGFVLGSFLGSKFALSLPQLTVKRLFAIVMMMLALKMLFFDKSGSKNRPEQINSGAAEPAGQNP